MSEPLCGVVVAHGNIAEGLVEAVEGITGVTDALTPFSNEGLGADQLRRKLGSRCEAGQTILFVDLASGSCGMAGLGLRRTAPGIAVVTGVNLPMLIEFVFNRHMPIDTLIERLEEKGRSSISGHACETDVAGMDRVADDATSAT